MSSFTQESKYKDVRKNLNSATTRTLRKNLDISVKVCSAINRYKRKKGRFRHIDELWRIPGMTRKVYDQVTKKYFVRGQSSPEIGEAETFEWASLSRSTLLDNRSFPSLKIGWRNLKKTKSPKPGPSGTDDKFVIENVRMASSYSSDPGQGSVKEEQNIVTLNKVRPLTPQRSKSKTPPKEESQEFPQMSGLRPLQFPDGFSSQSRLMMPITVQQSPSGNKLCIVYSCSSHHAPANITTPSKSPAKTRSKSSKPNSTVTTRSKSPSILKRRKAGGSSVSKSQLEEPSSSPGRDKRVGFDVHRPVNNVSRSASYCSAKQETFPKTVAESSRVYQEQGGVRTETIMERFQTVQGPSTSRAVDSTVASGEKVREWINSNSDFMKTPEVFGNMWSPTDLSPRPKMIDGKDVGKFKTVARGRIPPIHGSPRRNRQETLGQFRGKPHGIDMNEHKRRGGSPGGATGNTSANRSETGEGMGMSETNPPVPDRHDGQKHGFTFRRKKYRREKSREKTVVLPRKKRCKAPAKSTTESSQLCVVI